MTLTGVTDQRVVQRAAELLSGVACGTVDIHIAEAAEVLPVLNDDESYVLHIDASGINIDAATTWGALHGITTLWQIAAAGQLQGAGWHIEDRPRFSWRGLMIDVARHFMSLRLLLRIVDGMARLKLNVLHLHLTDDQGFRFTSAVFPGLASEAAYSQSELTELVEYAAARGVRVVPEIDVPGHVNCWLLNYPEWGLQPVQATTRFGVHNACLNPTDEAVYAALHALFTEVGAVFPDQFLHIGGDEVHPAWWNEDVQVQHFIAEHGLEDVRGMQSYFNKRIHEGLMQLGKRVIGWDEVLHPDVPAFVVQNWRGATTRDIALAQSLNCIVSAGYYLDLFYAADIYYRFDPEASQSQLVALEDEMKEDPRLAHVAAGLQWTDQWRDQAIDIEAASHTLEHGSVLGGEACLWSELVDEETLETRLWSRLPAVAERLWSASTTTDLHDFYRRLAWLVELPGFDLTVRQRGQLQRLGLSEDQIDVALVLEPVKWYARLLGEQALQARLKGKEMPQARPYDIHSELRRIVDFISPESLAAMALSEVTSDHLRVRCNTWVAQNPASWPEDARAAVGGLCEVGRIMLDILDSEVASHKSIDGYRDQLSAHYVPYGEYMLAVVPHLLDWLAKWSAGER